MFRSNRNVRALVWALWLVLFAMWIPFSVAAETTLTMAVGFGESQNLSRWFDIIRQRFQQRHPDVKLDLVHRAGEAILVAAAGGGELPDIIMAEGEDLSRFWKAGILESLDRMVKQSAEVSLENFAPAARTAVTFDGHVAGIPFFIGIQSLYYDAGVFKEVGLAAPRESLATWTSFNQAARRLATFNSKGELVRSGFTIPFWSASDFFPWMAANGASPFERAKYVPTVDVPAATEALRFLADLKASNLLRIGDPIAEFASGRTALMQGGNTVPNYIWNSNPDAKPTMYTYPPGPSGTSRGSWVWFHSFGINKKSRHADLAWDLVTVIAGTQGAEDWVKAWNTVVTPRVAFYRSDTWRRFVQANPTFEALPQALQLGQPMLWEDFSLWNGPLNTRVKEAVDGKISPEEALQQAQREIVAAVSRTEK